MLEVERRKRGHAITCIEPEAITIESWDATWEKVHQTQEWGKYPPEELIRFIATNFHKAPDRKAVRILDLGCGSGACIWYLAREGFTVYGIDGSKTAIQKAEQRLREENLRGEFRVSDIIRLPYPPSFFDCAIDVCSIQHNRFSMAKRIVKEVYRVLKPKGRFFSMLVAAGSWHEPFDTKGYVHFYKLSEVIQLLDPFKIISVEASTRTYGNMKNYVAHWVISAKRVCQLQVESRFKTVCARMPQKINVVSRAPFSPS
jgi:SAM-dependent methyltransferase